MSHLFVTQRPGAELDAVLPVFRCQELAGAPPLSNADLRALAAPFSERSIAESYRAPSFVTSDDRAVVLLIAKTSDAFRALRRAARVRLVCWRWDNTATGFVSLSLSVPGAGVVAPCPRWVGAHDDPAILCLRRTGRITMVVVDDKGTTSAWYTGIFGEKEVSIDLAMRKLESMFSNPLPCPAIHRFADALPGPLRAANREARRTGDFWAMLHETDPFWSDLGASDRARAVWGKEATENLFTATALSERMVSVQQNELPEGNWVESFPASATAFATALIGPCPNPLAAVEALQEVLRDPYAVYCIMGVLPAVVQSNDLQRQVFAATLTAALLDSRITDAGRRRPWFRNAYQSMQWDSIAVAPHAPLDSLATLWETCCEYVNLLDNGLYCTPETLPIPLHRVRDALRTVKLVGSLEETRQRIEELLYEARDARQWSIPWGARVQVSIGIFTSVRIFEINSEFTCHFLDAHDRFLPIALGVGSEDATYACPTLVNRLPREDRPPVEAAGTALLLIAAAIIRDFLVVEDRAAVFTGRAFKPRHGQKPQGPTIIYLPRVRYGRGAANPPAVNAEALQRVRHAVQQHLRRAGHASEAQRLLAMKYGVYLPTGYTFVRSHKRGGLGEEDRKRIYRSRSASLLLFAAMDPGPNTSTPEWFQFESDCAAILRYRGMTVIHHAANMRDGDGGMDLFAIEQDDQKVVVQCKCWAPTRPIGPEVIRELVGTIQLVDKDSGSISRGMIMTTTTFTPAAVTAAEELGIELIDGAAYLVHAREANVLPRSTTDHA